MTTLNLDANYLNIIIGRRKIRCLVDTGSSYSLFSLAMVKFLHLPIESLQNDDGKRLFAAQGSHYLSLVQLTYSLVFLAYFCIINFMLLATLLSP
jgi:hypothetical protein